MTATEVGVMQKKITDADREVRTIITSLIFMGCALRGEWVDRDQTWCRISPLSWNT